MGCCQPIRCPEQRHLNSSKRPKKSFLITPGDFVQLNTSPITDLYTFQGLLGSGAYSEVSKALHKPTNTLRAIKTIPLSSTSEYDISKLLKEVSILKRLNHPGIIKIFEVFQSPSNLSIVTELCSGGELFDRIKELKSFSENQAAQCMLQIVNAVMYCHSHGVVHRDLKPENVLYEDKKTSTLKLIDFGLSQIYTKRHKMKRLIGTYYYMAPEVLSGEYTEKCDVWSLGVILYIMLCGIPPFSGRTDDEIASQILNAQLSFTHPNWKNVSQEARMLIISMLKKKAEQRISIQSVFADPWLQSRGYGLAPDNELEAASLEALITFKAESQLQKAVYAFIVSQILDSEYFSTLREVFTEIDKNGDGLLSPQEILEVVQRFDFKVNLPELLGQCDSDRDGYINYTEFLAATVDRSKAYSKERIREVFDTFDKNHDGKLDLSELKNFLGGGQNSESVILGVLKETDTNGDGEIDFDEFLTQVGKYA